jgi:hypothetical protein
MNKPLSELPDDLVTLGDDSLSDDAILDLLRQRVEARRRELGVDKRRFPTFGVVAMPEEVEHSDPDLFLNLRRLNATFSDVPTHATLESSPATRVPILGSLWHRIRDQAHGLVLYYLNRYASHDIEINRNTVSVLNLLIGLSDAQQGEINALRAEIETLRRNA